jgi:predicted histidine transporter YuiF (NhaC family)
LSKKIAELVKKRKTMFILLIAFISCFSQNLIPVHIAFIPIIIPPLLELMNRLKIDRRAVACALTFGLETPYIAFPVGFGLIFHNIIRDQMIANGINITTDMVWKALWLPSIGMLVGLLIAVFFTYRNPREYKEIQVHDSKEIDIEEVNMMSRTQWIALAAAVVAFTIQLVTKSLPLGALGGIIFMIITGVIKWKEIDKLMDEGIIMMAFIALLCLLQQVMEAY